MAADATLGDDGDLDSLRGKPLKGIRIRAVGVRNGARGGAGFVEAVG